MQEELLSVGWPIKSSNLIINALFSLIYTGDLFDNVFIIRNCWKSDIFFSSRLAIVSSLGTLVWNIREQNFWIMIEPFFWSCPSKKGFPKLDLFFPLFWESTRRGYENSHTFYVFSQIHVVVSFYCELDEECSICQKTIKMTKQKK